MRPLARSIALNLPVSFLSAITWFGVYTLVNAYVTKGLGGSDPQWAAVTLWLAGGMAFWLLVCTEIIRLIGRRNTVTLSMLVAALAYASIAFTHNFTLIGVALATMAFTQAAISTAFWSLLLQTTDKPGRTLAIYQWTVTALTVASVSVGGFFAENNAYTTIFLGIGGISALCAIAFHVLSAPLRHDTTPVVSLWRLTRADLRDLLHAPYLRVLLLGICGEPWYYHMVNQLFRNHASLAFNLREDTIGLIVSLGRIPSLLTLIVVAHVIDRLNIARFYGIMLAISAIGAAIITAAPTATLMIIAYFAYYLIHGAVWGSNGAAINAQIPPRLRDTAFSVMSIAQSIMVFFVGVTQQRMLAAHWSIPRLFLACSALAVVCGVALALGAKGRRLEA